jgi:pSer/pThr/pTyr-binding forkhead associated (FHA) protein
MSEKESGIATGGRDGLVLHGETGMLAGEQVLVPLGGSVVVGRSRSCDLSTRKSRAFRQASEAEQRVILAARDFLRVSRRHVRITWRSKTQVEIRDLSRNGTWVNGVRIDRLMLPPPAEDPVEIRLANTETLRLRRA